MTHTQEEQSQSVIIINRTRKPQPHTRAYPAHVSGATHAVALAPRRRIGTRRKQASGCTEPPQWQSEQRH